MADYRFPKSSRDSLQSIRLSKPWIGERDALEALENLMLLHESLDQLELWKKFLDSHTALSLPPWRTGVRNDRIPVIASQAPKVLLRRTSRGRTESAPTKGTLLIHSYSNAFVFILLSLAKYSHVVLTVPSFVIDAIPLSSAGQ
jgi:hypothetical protein